MSDLREIVFGWYGPVFGWGLFAALLALAGMLFCRLLSAGADAPAARRDSSWLERGVFVAFLCIAIVCGAIKPGSMPTNAPAPRAQVRMVNAAGSISPAEEAAMAEADEGMLLIGNWFRSGGRGRGHVVSFDNGWVFPHGSNHLSRIEIWPTGAVYAGMKDPTPIAAISVPLSPKPQTTRVYCGMTPDGDFRVEWCEAYAHRDPNQPMDASIDLHRDGRITITENGVTRTIDRVLPFPHDGYGQDDDWVRANFTNAEEIISTGYVNWVQQTVQSNVPNGLFALDVTFAHDPPEVIDLAVGKYHVAVREAGRYSFVLEKGETLPLALSAFCTDIEWSCRDADVRHGQDAGRSMRTAASAANVRTELVATGADGEVEIIVPCAASLSGHVTWMPWLSIAPDHVVEPDYPLILSAYLDLPLGAIPTVRWESSDGKLLGTGENLWLSEEPPGTEITVRVKYRAAELVGYVTLRRIVSESRIALSRPPVVVVEDPYTNRPGEVVYRTSSTAKMTAEWELAESGRLLLEASDDMSLRVCLGDGEGGEIALPYEMGWFAAHSLGSQDFSLTSTNMNVVGDVGSYRLRFVPDEDEPREVAASAKVVKIRVEADANWPSNKVRHMFGPTEGFDVIFVNGGYSRCHIDPNGCIGDRTIAITNYDFICKVDVSIIAPTGLRGEYVREMTDDDWKIVECDPLYDGVCGAGFIARWHLEPEWVSFEELKFQEGFAPMYPKSGCFLDETKYPPAQYSHHRGGGAWELTKISGMNHVGEEGDYDSIGVQFGIPPMTPGSYTLAIPQYWGLSDDSCTNVICILNQTVTVDGRGNTIITKGEFSQERNALK